MMQRVGWLARAGQVALAMLVLTVVVAGCAQAPPQDTMRARQRALFEQTFREPSNIEAALEYAKVSSELGDYEAAITVLERMHLFAPDLPRVHAELGVLYYRIGAYDIARDYFNRASSAPNLPDDARQRIEPYMADLAVRTAGLASDNEQLALAGVGFRL